MTHIRKIAVDERVLCWWVPRGSEGVKIRCPQGCIHYFHLGLKPWKGAGSATPETVEYLVRNKLWQLDHQKNA